MKSKKKINWWAIYFIIAYLIVIILGTMATINELDREYKDEWVEADCPIKNNYRVASPEVVCERHEVYDRADKAITIFVIWLIGLIAPFLVILIFAVIWGVYDDAT